MKTKVTVSWEWYDGWVGYFWDGEKGYLYVCFPIPWLVWRIDCYGRR